MGRYIFGVLRSQPGGILESKCKKSGDGNMVKKNWPGETREEAFWGRSKGNNFKDWEISRSAENILKVDPGMGR